MRIVVYDTDSGEIVRSGNVAPPHLGKQNWRDVDGLLTDGAVPDSVPDSVPAHSVDVPRDTTGLMVDTSTSPPSLVQDPNYSEPYTAAEWAADRQAGNFSSDSEALDRLAEALQQ